MMKMSINEFNKQHNISIKEGFELYEVFEELEKTNLECCFIALTKEKANQAILKVETLINLEDKYYFCVR